MNTSLNGEAAKFTIEVMEDENCFIIFSNEMKCCFPVAKDKLSKVISELIQEWSDLRNQ
jgi:hypothetical protein